MRKLKSLKLPILKMLKKIKKEEFVMKEREMELEKSNSLKAINNYLFRALERLDDDSISTSAMANEIARANAISSASKVVINTLKTRIDVARMKNGKQLLDDVGLDYE